VATHQAEFQAKPHEWHSRLAEILNDRKLFGNYKEAILELPLYLYATVSGSLVTMATIWSTFLVIHASETFRQVSMCLL